MWERVIGPLVELECRRTLARSWLIWLRALAAVPSVFLLLFVLWIFWILNTQDAEFSPGGLLRGGFCCLEVMLVAGALLLGPALISAALAGDKARGMITLLLAGNVSPKDVVLGRMSGGVLLAIILLSGSFPIVATFAGWGGLSWQSFLGALFLPVAVLLGSGGLALALSSVAKRSRDALLTSYVLLLLWILGLPLLFYFLPYPWTTKTTFLNPIFAAIKISIEGTGTVWQTCVLWCFMALVGVAYATWRIRPAFLSRDADSPKQLRVHARRKAKHVGKNPMLWKELHFEQQAYGTKIGQLIAKCFFALVFLATLILAGIAIGSETYWPNVTWSIWARDILEKIATFLSLPLSWLIQWWLGIRAATGIVAERERDTWDPLLLSPLESSEIVRGKILGALYAMRWLLVVTTVIWIVPAALQSMTISVLLERVAITLSAGAFMASVGVYCSLVTRSTGAATALVIGIWCAAAFFIMIMAFVATVMVTLLIFLVWTVMPDQAKNFIETFFGPWVQQVQFINGMTVFRVLGYLGSAYLVGLVCRRSFDRLSGRHLGIRRGAPIPQRHTPQSSY